MSNKFNLEVSLEMDFNELLKSDNAFVALLALGGSKPEDIVVNFANNLSNNIKAFINSKYHNVTVSNVSINEHTDPEEIIEDDSEIDEDSPTEYIDGSQPQDQEEYEENQRIEEERILAEQDERVNSSVNNIFESIQNIRGKDGKIEQLIIYNDKAFYNKLLELNLSYDVIFVENTDRENLYMIRYYDSNNELKEYFEGDVL